MSDRGVVAIDRGVFDHPAFAPEPFTEREAWIWMITAAAWKPTRVRSGRQVVDVARGQMAFATRFMAAKFKWSQARVVRFLKRLETEAMIVALATRQTTHITLCNYDRYAFNGIARGTECGSPSGSPATHGRFKEEEPKEPKNKEEKNMGGREATRPLLSDPFEDFWKAYPKRVGSNPKQPAKRKFVALAKSGTDPAAIVRGAERYASLVAKLGQAGTPYIKQAIGWLNAGMWTDDYSSADHPPKASENHEGWTPGKPTHEEMLARYGKRAAETNQIGEINGTPIKADTPVVPVRH